MIIIINYINYIITIKYFNIIFKIFFIHFNLIIILSFQIIYLNIIDSVHSIANKQINKQTNNP